MDERLRKRQLAAQKEALAFGIERDPVVVLRENVQTGRWVLLHRAVGMATYHLLASLGSPYLGDEIDTEADLVWGWGFEDSERREAGAKAALIYDGHLRALGFPMDASVLLDHAWLVEVFSPTAKERLEKILEGSDAYFWKKFNTWLTRKRHLPLVFRNGDTVHTSCFDFARKDIESKWHGRLEERMLNRWPKGKACAICGGKTIRPKGSK